MVLEAASVPMTQEGRAWLIKALHPSDASHGMSGIPTRDSRPTVPLNFMVTQNIAAPAAASWSADVFLNPSPLYFGKVITQAGATYGTTTIANTQLGITGFAEFGGPARTWNASALGAWFNNVTKYRLCYSSVTATLSASATSNEGVVTCAQYPYSYRDGTCPQFNVTAAATDLLVNNASRVVPTGVRASQALQAMVGSTTWEAREGAYSILRLSEEALNWKTPSSVLYPVAITGTYQISQSTTVNTAACTSFTAAAAASANDVPFGPQGIWGIPNSSNSGITYIANQSGAPTTVPSQDFVSHLRFSGLDSTATLQLTYRVGFEAIVPPESIYVGQVTPALIPDSVALDAYFNAARFLQSAYPASFNIFGALAGLANLALPVLKDIGAKLLPHAVSAVGSVLGMNVATPSNVLTTQNSIQPRYREEVVYRQPVQQQQGKKQKVKQTRKMKQRTPVYYGPANRPR
jgi:hypothetical protein